MTHHSPDSGEANTFPLIVFSEALRRSYIQMAIFPRIPKLESRNCPETIPVGVPGLWELIIPDWRVRSQQDLNQSCNPRRDLSNSLSHFQIGCREKVDSRRLVVGSQTASLTPGPSFAHNVGCRCPNGQCEASLDIYIWRPFQWHKEHPNARCFDSSTWVLSFWESRRTKFPLSGVWASPSHLAQSGVATLLHSQEHEMWFSNFLLGLHPCKPLPWLQAQG
jgi:hypothetical protein